MQHSFPALGTTWWITCFDERPEADLQTALHAAEAFVQTFESRYSRFQADSLITHLNETGELTNPPTELIELLTYGKQLYLATNTHFNLLTGHVLEARGYDAAYSFTPTDTTVTPGNPITDLIIDDAKITVTNSKVDLGGFGKGYLIDRLAAHVQEQFSWQYFLINGGGDMWASSRHGEPITIYLEHPTKPQHYLGTTTLKDQAFASSSPFKRVWLSATGTYDHIVAPGTVAQEASYIKARRAAWADALATTTLLVPSTESKRLGADDPETTIARFSPETGQFWSTPDFAFTPYAPSGTEHDS